MSEAEVRAIATAAAKAVVDAALARLVITGPGVSGDAKTGWAINGPTSATAVCNDDGTITITFT